MEPITTPFTGTSTAAEVIAGTDLTGPDGITVNAVHPGAIWTNLARHMTEAELERARGMGYTYKTVEQGAATSVLLAASPLLAGVTGRYFEDGNQADPHQPGPLGGVCAHALDPVAADRLWRVSLELLVTA